MTSPASEPAPGWRWTRWLPLATAVALALAVVFLRVCEVEAEGDLYHERAEQLLAGTVVFDAFHPFGYVLLLAAVHVFVSPSLVAGGLVSAAAAGVLVWSTGVVAETLRPGAGGPARLFAASNGVVWVLGTMACSDMTSAALVMWAAALLCRSPGQLGFGRSVAIGSLLGYAVGSRFGSLGVAALVCLWTVLRCPRARSVSGLAVGVLAGLAPQAWLAALVDKTPLQNDNWHNMVLKIVCDDDLSRLQHLYDSGTLPSLSDFLREHGGDLLWRAGLDSVTAVGQVLPSLLMGSLRPVDGLQLWPLLLALAGLWFAAPRRRLAAVLTVLAAAATFSVCIAIAPRGRQLFSAIPFLFAGLAAALAALHARGGVCRAILPALWLATVGVGGAQFHHFLAEQPRRAVEVMRQLPELLPRPFGLLTTNAVTHRYTTCMTWAYLASRFASTEAAWNGLREIMTRSGADVFLAGRISNPKAYDYFSSDPVPDDFHRLLLDEDVVLLELVRPPTTWIDTFSLSPDPPMAGQPLDLEVVLSASADLSVTMAVGAVMRDPTGAQRLLHLERLEERRYRHHVVMPNTPGNWMVEPFVLQVDGTVQRGRRIEFVASR